MIRILLAEDDEAMRVYLVRALERVGYDVTSVDRGTAAIPLLERAVLLDPKDRLLRVSLADGLRHAQRYEEARQILDDQLANLEDLARWTAAHIASAVLEDPRAATNAAFIRGIDINNLQFDPAAMAESLAAACRETSET